jgi:drug/metabolite transporter (DMT)-like permease
MSNTMRGMLPLLGYVILIAATDVYAGNKLQSLSPVTVAAVSFTLAALWFLGLDIRRRGVRSAFRPVRTHRHDVIAINVMTATVWLTLLFALKYLEPAVVNVVAFAIGPALTVLLSPLLRKGSKVLVTELVVALAIFVLIGVLSWGSVTGLSAIGHLSSGQAVLGLILGVVCGVACVGNTIYSKRLSDAGLTPVSTLAVRYFLMIVVAWPLVVASGDPGFVETLVPGAVIALIGVGLPNYLGQVGIRYVEPITASLVDTLSPVFAFTLQLLDGRLSTSAFSFVSILGITIMVGLGVVARSRYEKRETGAGVAELPVAIPVKSGSESGVARAA